MRAKEAAILDQDGNGKRYLDWERVAYLAIVEKGGDIGGPEDGDEGEEVKKENGRQREQKPSIKVLEHQIADDNSEVYEDEGQHIRAFPQLALGKRVYASNQAASLDAGPKPEFWR